MNSPTPVTHIATPHNPNACSKPSCGNVPTNQYQASDGQQNILAVFTCAAHAYTDPIQQVALHSATCTLFPCNCNPTAPSPTPAVVK